MTSSLRDKKKEVGPDQLDQPVGLGWLERQGKKINQLRKNRDFRISRGRRKKRSTSWLGYNTTTDIYFR